ncbi:MAG TPA: TRL domain-containing protein [Myxococcota bacterium]|nr:TRL domain-containing protein [Myxococcota bacterium]
MRRALLVCLLAVAFATSGCISYVTPVGNMTHIQEVDMTSDFKTGESCAWWLLFNFLGPFGDMSVVKASQGAGIRKVEVVDYRAENYILAQRLCAYVYGK